MPEFLLTVAKAIIDHDGMRSQLSVNTWEADTIRPVSKYALDLKQVNPANIRISQGWYYVFSSHEKVYIHVCMYECIYIHCISEYIIYELLKKPLSFVIAMYVGCQTRNNGETKKVVVRRIFG